MRLIRGRNPNFVKESKRNKVFTGNKILDIPVDGRKWYTFLAWVKDAAGDSFVSFHGYKKGKKAGEPFPIKKIQLKLQKG